MCVWRRVVRTYVDIAKTGKMPYIGIDGQTRRRIESWTERQTEPHRVSIRYLDMAASCMSLVNVMVPRYYFWGLSSCANYKFLHSNPTLIFESREHEGGKSALLNRPLNTGWPLDRSKQFRRNNLGLGFDRFRHRMTASHRVTALYGVTAVIQNDLIIHSDRLIQCICFYTEWPLYTGWPTYTGWLINTGWPLYTGWLLDTEVLYWHVL